MIPALVLTRNCLELTIPCVVSVKEQNYPTTPFIFDNGSTDGTREWLKFHNVQGMGAPENRGVSAGWNLGLTQLFSNPQISRVLVLNNDAILPPWFVRELLSYNEEFITGVAVDYMPEEKAERMPLVPHPDFSAFLIHRNVWQKLGAFDERMFGWASDCDMHCRAHQKGVAMWKANVPYYHINSQTTKRTIPEEQKFFHERAHLDREVFREKWGFLPGTKEYEEFFRQ